MHRSEIAAMCAPVATSWQGLLDEPGLYVSEQGHVLSLRKKRPAFLTLGRRGLYKSLPGGRYLHVAVCEAFHGPRPDGMEVRHLDGNRDNNAVSNLAWGTRKENAADRVVHGTDVSGERNPMARLTREAVEAMRAAYAANPHQRFKDIAKAFGVSTMTAHRAIRGQSWK